MRGEVAQSCHLQDLHGGAGAFLLQDINRGSHGAPSHPLSLAQSPWPYVCQLVQRGADCRRKLPIAMETKAGSQHPAAPRHIANVPLLGSKSSDTPPT